VRAPWRKPLAGLALVAFAAAGATAAYGVSQRSTATPLLDIEIAIDTTSSMGASISQAQADSKRLVTEVQRRYPGAMFAVVQFRDSTDTPEYQVMQPMTADGNAVDAAIDTLQPAGGGDFPEAYNLVFQQSYTDPNTGWRPNTRKLVVVIGDAEAHGARTSGFTSCNDTSADPHGLSTADVLAGMKTNQRTLIMVRQATTASTSLECYQQLAAAAFTGGAARNGGDDIVSVIEALITSAATTPTATGTKPTTTGRTTTGPLPPVPPAGKVNGTPSGTVLIKVGGKFVPLTSPRVIPYGTELDTTRGRITITARDGSTGTFREAQFKLVAELDTFSPGKPARRASTILLTGDDFKKCTARKTSGVGQARKRPVRHVWGNAKGSFRTKGKYAAATVRGTLWLTTDYCEGTNVRVVRGKLDVFDRVKRKHTLVAAGHSLFVPLGRVRPGG
jgi:Mg-chelatase subunit ChlD